MNPLPFIPDQIYKRSEIHDQYGGSRFSGISDTVKYPFIFIFSGSSGEQHGYKDEWYNKNVFAYSGEGQVGDMKFIKGNLALRDHLKTGKRVFLFEFVNKGMWRFISELILLEFNFFKGQDRQGNQRIGIKFFFQRINAIVSKAYDDQPLLSFAAETIDEYLKPTITERQGIVTSRVGQGAYRKSILYRWEEKCAVTGYNKPEILIASHILGWKISNNDQRLDVDNGILLSPTYDALFDRHLISFDDSGKIILSDKIEMEAYAKIGVTGKEHIKGFHSGNHFYLNMHRNRLELT